MTAQDTKAQLSILMKMWAQKAEAKDHHNALIYAFLGYMMSKGAQDEDSAMGFIGPIEAACFDLLEPLLEKRKAMLKDEVMCSFCNRREPEVKLAAGPDAFICDGCVKMLAEEVFPPKH